eukprot:438202-Amphidinium_carterae.1
MIASVDQRNSQMMSGLDTFLESLQGVSVCDKLTSKLHSGGDELPLSSSSTLVEAASAVAAP